MVFLSVLNYWFKHGIMRLQSGCSRGDNAESPPRPRAGKVTGHRPRPLHTCTAPMHLWLRLRDGRGYPRWKWNEPESRHGASASAWHGMAWWGIRRSNKMTRTLISINSHSEQWSIPTKSKQHSWRLQWKWGKIFFNRDHNNGLHVLGAKHNNASPNRKCRITSQGVIRLESKQCGGGGRWNEQGSHAKKPRSPCSSVLGSS